MADLLIDILIDDDEPTEIGKNPAARDLATSGSSDAARELNERRQRSVGTCQGPDCSNPIYGYASKRYCSERCNQRAWRARRRAQGYVFGHAGRLKSREDPATGVVVVFPDRRATTTSDE